MLPGDMAKALAEKLREELTTGEDYFGHFLPLIGLDSHFIAVLLKDDYSLEVAPASLYWTFPSRCDADGSLRCPATLREVRVSSRRAFRCGHLSIKTKLPALQDGMAVDFGFETTRMARGMTAQFKFWKDSAGEHFGAYVMGLQREFSWALPSDAKTAQHTYSIKLNLPNVEFYVDGKLIAVAVHANLPTTITVSGPPYDIWSSNKELYRQGVGESPYGVISLEADPNLVGELVFPVNPMDIECAEGEPLPPRSYDLYLAGSGTKLAGYSISSGSVTSHPVPVFGYVNKTVYFMADQAGTLNIEVLMRSGNWRTYDSVTVPASALLKYKMTGDAILARLTFTPSSYPCTISEAEVNMSG
jgi:hypothetical protein